MIHYLLRFTSLIILTLLCCLSCAAQAKSNKSAQELFAEVKEDEKAVLECVRKTRDYQIAKFGKVMPEVTGDFCFNGCPVSLVRPYYPREAKRLRMSGLVKVETIVDESGRVIYAKTLKGSPFLSRVAEQ